MFLQEDWSVWHCIGIHRLPTLGRKCDVQGGATLNLSASAVYQFIPPHYSIEWPLQPGAKATSYPGAGVNREYGAASGYVSLFRV